MTGDAGAESDRLSARIAALRTDDPGLSALGAALLAAVELAIASDSRTFAKAFGVEHALVLREIAGLESAGRIVVEQRDGRTMRTKISLL